MTTRDPSLYEPHWRLKIIEASVYAPIKFYLWLSGSTIARHPIDIDPNHVYIVAANHVSMLDPFIVPCSLDRQIIRQLYPFRTMSTTRLMSKPLLLAPMRLLGGFPSHPMRNWLSGVEAAHAVIAKKHTVVIFPQGGIKYYSTEAKYGVFKITSAHPGSRIIPVSLYKRRGRFGMMAYDIVTGETIDPEEYTPEGLMKHIVVLQTKNHGKE
jgi:1-acyl-sn-glycerol-3-phosphate acyltransferase